MRVFQRLLIFFLLAGLLAASAPTYPVRAKAISQDTWEPGSYSGWVYLLARLTKNHKIQQQGVTLTQDTVVFWQAHGDVDASVNAQGEGLMNAYLPLEINAMEVGSFTSAAGSCSFNIAGSGEAYPQNLARLVPEPLTDSMRLGLIMPNVSASVTNNSVEGECGTMAQTSLFIQETIKNTTQKMSDMTFKVGYRTPLSVGGTCELKDWNQSMPLPNGTLTRELLECSWRVFRAPR